MAEANHIDTDAPVLQASELKTEKSTYAAQDAPGPVPESILTEALLTQAPQPTLVPPTELAAEAAEEGIAAWLSNKKITALWMNESARNTWIMVDGVGWKKLSNANDSAWLSMVMLGSHAEQTNATVNVRVEADNMVHSLYVW